MSAILTLLDICIRFNDGTINIYYMRLRPDSNIDIQRHAADEEIEAQKRKLKWIWKSISLPHVYGIPRWVAFDDTFSIYGTI